MALFDPGQTPLDPRLDLDAFLSVPHVLLSTRGDRHGPIDDKLATLGRKRQILASMPRFSTMPFVLKSRPSIVCMPATAAAYYAQLFELDTRPLPFDSPTFAVSVLWHLRADRDPGLTWFRDILVDAVRTLADPS